MFYSAHLFLPVHNWFFLYTFTAFYSLFMSTPPTSALFYVSDSIFLLFSFSFYTYCRSIVEGSRRTLPPSASVWFLCTWQPKDLKLIRLVEPSVKVDLIFHWIIVDRCDRETGYLPDRKQKWYVNLSRDFTPRPGHQPIFLTTRPYEPLMC